MRTCTVLAVASAIFALSTGVAQASVGFDNCTEKFISGFIPAGPKGAVNICRGGEIAIAYDAEMVNPAYSAYRVTPTDAQHESTGRLSFYQDPDLEALGVKQASKDAEVWSEDWNRGHLCPNHILSYNYNAKHATFTMANVAPQAGYLNQHPWNYLENDVCEWIAAKNPLHLVTGVAYKDRSTARRVDGIAVPDYYWKVICDVTAGESVGFLADNVESGDVKLMSVYDVQNTFGGYLFPYSTCNTHAVNRSHWWPDAAFARVVRGGVRDAMPNATRAMDARKAMENDPTAVRRV